MFFIEELKHIILIVVCNVSASLCCMLKYQWMFVHFLEVLPFLQSCLPVFVI